MDAVTPKAQAADQHSHVVRPAAMEWQKTRFPVCEAKTLLFDKATGLVTALMRFAPGAVLPDHEHVKIEQTYVLEGKLVDREGPAAGLEVGAWIALGAAMVLAAGAILSRARISLVITLKPNEGTGRSRREPDPEPPPVPTAPEGDLEAETATQPLPRGSRS